MKRNCFNNFIDDMAIINDMVNLVVKMVFK